MTCWLRCGVVAPGAGGLFRRQLWGPRVGPSRLGGGRARRGVRARELLGDEIESVGAIAIDGAAGRSGTLRDGVEARGHEAAIALAVEGPDDIVGIARLSLPGNAEWAQQLPLVVGDVEGPDLRADAVP